MLVFYDDATGQVEAVYCGGTNSTEWSSHESVVSCDPSKVCLICDYCRDCKITVVDGQIDTVTESVNPSQPSGPCGD